MPIVHVFDRAARRDWKQICDQGNIRPELTMEMKGFDELTAIEAGSVVVCHGVERDEEITVEELAGNHGFYAIHVSGAPRSAAPIGERGYRRGAPVLDDDRRFGGYLARFCEDLEENGAPNFALLEPGRWPECLVALYLRVLAHRDNSATDMFDGLGWGEFWEPALAAVEERRGHCQEWMDSGFPSVEDALKDWRPPDDLEAARDLLTKCLGP